MSEREERRERLDKKLENFNYVGSDIMLSQTLGVKTAAKKITAVANSELQIKYRKVLM